MWFTNIVIFSQNNGVITSSGKNIRSAQQVRVSVGTNNMSSGMPSAGAKQTIPKTSRSDSAQGNKSIIRLTSNPNPMSQVSASATPNPTNHSPTKNAATNAASSRYRPNTLNTLASKERKLGSEKQINMSATSRQAVPKNKEPVYATVGSVNSSQRRLSNLKSANV